MWDKILKKSIEDSAGSQFEEIGSKRVNYILFIEVVPKGNAMFEIIDDS